MAANSSLNLTSLDFDSLKQNFITFLKSQTIFKDYDFSGSNLNVLLDILSYNTYLNSFYLNMIGSEAFLDTAQIRNSVVSIAKELNYVPRSARSAVATVNMTFNTTGLNGTLVIPTGTMYTGVNSRGSFSFVTNKVHTILSAGSQYNIRGVELYEGKVFTETFIVDNTVENQKFVLSNLSIDNSSISVSVTASDQTVAYSQVYNLYGLTSSSPVYFVQEDPGSLYEVYFGDGVFGTVPPNAAVITVIYRVTRGAAGNDVGRFNLSQDLNISNGGKISAIVTTVDISSDGADIESIESVRYRAPKSYQVQNRAITASDYANLIEQNFPEIKDVSVFGGEEVFGSVQYGTVFISCTTYSGAPITQSIEHIISNYLDKIKAIGTTITFVNPDYLYLVPSITAYVDFSKTTLSPTDIYSKILGNVQTYNDVNLKTFNSSFMLSKFCTQVDDSDSSIVGDTTTLQMYKNVLFSNGYPQTLTVPFNNAIVPGTIRSSNFVLNDGNVYRLTDFNPKENTFSGQDANGAFNIVNSTNLVYFSQIVSNSAQNYINAGIIDYANGSIHIQSIDVLNFMNPLGIKVSCVPASEEVYSSHQLILEIDPTEIHINITTAA